jgi:hypothetical protein
MPGVSRVAISEVQLDHALAEAIEAQPEFRAFLLSSGRFSRYATDASLKVDEQGLARRSAKHWWKHWWCRLPDGTESETDVFLVFEADGSRFALHIENKPPHGKLGIKQAADYRRRAAFMANDARFLSYSDFETVLVAPAEFIARHSDCVKQFDRSITYEQVAEFAPLFGIALTGGRQL